MLKNILNLNGAQEISKNEQKSINGGITRQCVDAIANGCVVGVTPANCTAQGGFYSTACKCCNL